MAERDAAGKVTIVPATPGKEREAEFIMLHEGFIVFEGDADALRQSKDPYIRTFLT
jgi:ABC-type transporter Mla maintaining outer membrane lipid asymmetry ATPase subunit MlaF